MSNRPFAQRGATLVIGMIMLVLVTLFVLAAINMSTVNLRIMGNQQARNESIAAAQQAIEQVVSTDFTAAPVAVTVPVDINGDGTTDYNVTVAQPTCLNSVPIKLSTLRPLNANGTINQKDAQCELSGPSRSAGIAGAAGTGNSICSNTQWELNATTSDAATGSGAAVTVHQGVGTRVLLGTPC